MRSHAVVWTLRLCWLALPFTLGEAIGRALDGRSPAVAIVAAVLSWAVWGAVLVAAIVAHPISLTVLRVGAPLAPVAAVAVATAWAPTHPTGTNTAATIVGLVLALVAAATAMSGITADEYVDAASYGDERRFALRVPATFLLGPIPVFWVAFVGGCLAGPLLLAARAWIAGAILLAIGVAVARPAITSFHALSRRWLVFVPAGVTLIDHLGLVDPVLFPARQIATIAPAVEGTSATDLSQNALGLVLEISFDSPVEVVARTSRSEGEVQLLNAVLITPARPGAVIAEAGRRKLRTVSA